MRNLFLSGIFALLLITCSSTKNQQSNFAAEQVPVCPEFTFSTGPCFGYCPIFEITIDTSGIAQLIGKRFTYPSGLFRDTLSSQQVIQLHRHVNAIQWDTVPERYESRIADAQTYFFKSGDTTQTIGSFAMPSTFDSLRVFFFDLQKNMSWEAYEDENYEKIAQNDGAFVRFTQEVDLSSLQQKHPFLSQSVFTTLDQDKHLYMLHSNNTNLDYSGLEKQLMKLDIVDQVEPILQLKKKKSVLQGNLEK